MNIFRRLRRAFDSVHYAYRKLRHECVDLSLAIDTIEVHDKHVAVKL